MYSMIYCNLLYLLLFFFVTFFFFFKQKTAYEMRISDWSSDVCSSDLHVVQLVLAGLQLGRILFVLVAQLGDVGVPEQRVVVEVHLGVERHDVAGTGHHQRVDLHQRGVELDERLVDRGDELDRRDRKSTRLNSSH